MSNEQTTQETVPVETTNPSTAPEEIKKETPISATTEQPATVAKSWKDAISQEYRDDQNIQKFTEIDALAKSYINATKMIGQDKMVIPNNNSTDDQWNEVYEKLGRPESAEKYKLEAKSDVVPMDEGAIKTFAEQSHKLGLNNKQAQGILEFYKNSMEGTAKQAQVDTETAQAQSTQELRQEWGRDFDAKIKQAASLAKANISADVLDMQLQNGTRLGDHPEIIKGFAKIANMMSEDKILSTESENVNVGKDLESEIATIMNNRAGPYWNKQHPDHDKSVQQLYTLREMANSNK
jgi:hypothetical protein